MTMNSQPSKTKKIFNPEDGRQLLEAWLLHAHKGRQRHDRAARRYDLWRLWLGGVATGFAVVVGTSIYAALEKSAPNAYVKVSVVALGLISAILNGVSTYLNLPERVEKHRNAGVSYKAVIRDLERVLSHKGAGSLSHTDPQLMEIQKRLDELEQTMPVVSEKIYNQVEDDWKKQGINFVGVAAELYRSKDQSLLSDR